MKYLYRFNFDGWYGGLHGLFFATPEQVAWVSGEEVHFGEVMGKHSSVFLTMDPELIERVDISDLLSEELRDAFGNGDSLLGWNPVEVLLESLTDDIEFGGEDDPSQIALLRAYPQ